MASIAEVLSDQEKTNWLNACIALNILKSGLKDFVNQEMQRVKTHMFHSAHRKLNLPDTEMCTMCNVACLVPCPTKGYCKSGKRCTNGHRRCPKNICNEISNLIINEHRYSNPSWTNTEAEQWAFNQWQIAKCFLPPDGYTGVGSVEDTDFNGIISVMLNCKTFDLKLSFPIAHNKPNQCLLSKARAFGRAVRHTPNFTMKEDVLQDMFNTLSAILKDPKCLGNDISAQEAERKLNQLRNDKMTFPEMIQLVLYAQNEKKRITEENKIDFRHRLVELYNKLRSVPVFPLVPCNDRPLRKIYCTPILLHIPKHTFGSRTNTEKIRTYMDIIFTNGELNKNVFIQGEPGIGKSIFVAKMVLDWCDASLSKHPSSKKTAFCDIETLLVYKFVFLVTLRDANRQREVIDMIKSQIVDEIYSSEEDRGNAYTIVQQIMKSEMCLVIQDGMDEWSDYNGVNVLPVMVLCHSHSTVLTTTREWKMADERVKDSKVDRLFELAGIEDEKRFSRKILGLLINDDMEKHADFLEYVEKNNLHDLLRTPMLNSLIVCSWIDGAHLTGSMCTIYSILLDCLFKKTSDRIEYFQSAPFKCFENRQYLKPNFECLEALSKAGFHTLFCSEKENSVVFSDRELLKYISPEQKLVALKSGVLLERKSTQLTIRTSTCSFIYKSIQEFFAAFHCARDENVIDNNLKGYITQSDNLCLDMARVLQFLCGLDIKSANKLSVIIYEHSKSLDLQVRHQRELQSMVLNGYVEAILDNKNAGDICLKLSYFDFTTLNINKHKHTDLKEILLINKSNVRTLRLNPDALRCLELSDFEEILHLSETCIERMYIYANDRTHLKTLSTSTYFEFMSTSYNLDLSSCKNLKKLHIDGPLNVLPNAFQGLSMLKCARLKCKCNFLNVSTCQNLNELYVGEHVTLLQNALIGLMNLKMLTVKCVCGKPITLDLSTCRGLEQLIIEGDVILLPNALCELVELKSIKLWCECVGLDVSSCHNLEEMVIFNGVTLASNVILELLKLIRVTIKGRCDTLDLSLCAHLEDVVIDGEVMLLPNALKGLRQLKRISLRCLCSDLDLTQCDNLECIDLGENVTVLPNTLANVKTMARFTLSNNGHKSADILKWWPVHMGGISLPPNLNNVVLRRLNFPPMWLKCLLGTLSKSDHPSQYTFDMCSITTNVESREQTSEGVTHLDYMTIKRSTSNIRLHIGSDCVQLYEALQDTIIESLTIQCVNSFNVLAETLINIIGLKELRINFQTFGDFDIPTSVVYVFLIFSSLSSSSLFNLLNSLSLHNPGVKCKVLFKMTEPKDKYEVVRTELDSLECIRVERFETLTHIIDCLEMAWNYTDDEDKIDVDDADSEFCCFDTKGIEDEDSDQNEESVASDTDDNDYTSALGADNKSSNQYLLMHLCINSRNCVLPPT